jgi:PAS domain S-box-containing protein
MSEPGRNAAACDMSALGAAVLSTQSDAIVAANKEGIIIYWNPGAERMFGYDSGQALGQSLDIIIPERLRKRHWEGFAHVMNGGRSRYESGDVLAVPAVRRDGTQISVEFTLVPLRGDAGVLTGLAAIMRDVTKRFEEIRGLKKRLADTAGPAGSR